MSDKPVIRRSMEYRIKKRPVLEPEPATLNPPNHTVCVAGNGYGWTRPSFVEKEQQVVNQLRKHMTPRITKKIGKAFNKVRYAKCSLVKKVQYKMELVEQVKELEHRRDADEAERQMKVLLQAVGRPKRGVAMVYVNLSGRPLTSVHDGHNASLRQRRRR